jgi:aldehyde:ferredoxin oxidoreductase
MEEKMAGGYTGRIGFVDLSEGKIQEERLDEGVAHDFIGGYGLGVRTLFELQKKGVNPLGPDNILGFTTGPLTGTKTPSSGRYTVVCKSPLTGCWGDANSGGFFGGEMKSAGWDALFISGAAAGPKYLFVTDEGIELKDASHLWGKDAIETEEILGKEYEGAKIKVACIGPASEKLSLISGIVNDKGRIAARAGVGAVMGSKRLEAVVVFGKGKTRVADQERLDSLRKSFMKEFREMKAFPEILTKYGTCGLTGALTLGGATPIKNWLYAGKQAFPSFNKIADGDTVLQYQTRKYACEGCPIACGGIFEVSKGAYPVAEVHKPEYETIGAFGNMCMNDDLLSIIKMTDMCNRSGLDTISAGSVIAFAMECYEKGIISRADIDGIELTWGNSDAMIAMLEKIIKREGFGDILADGVRVAAKKIGKASEDFAIHVGGQEPGLHNALFLPGRGTGYVSDPTPGRHTATPMARLDGAAATIAPYPELHFENFDRYEYRAKGGASATASCYYQVGACAGACLFPLIFFGNYPMMDFLNAVTGWEMDMDGLLKTGARIQTLRECFNIREGIDPAQIKLPPRMAGLPPKTDGPLSDVTIDIDALVSEYSKAMGWDPKSRRPKSETLSRLGLSDLVGKYGE